MSRTPITIETCTLRDWTDVGARLRELEPDEFARLLALARGFVSIHDRELESREEFDVRLTQIAAGKAEA